MQIRKFKPSEELTLREIFHSSVHGLAKNKYSPDQLSAWAPIEFDSAAWVSTIQGFNPWVVVAHGELVAYADLQADGYIDHFYVSGPHGRMGYGSALMAHLISEGQKNHLECLHSKVSLSAQPLFLKSGFNIRSVNTFILRGVEISNATMVKMLLA